MNTKVSIALIGAGNMGAYHARVLSSIPNAQLVAVVDTNRQRAIELAERHGATPFASTDELLESGPKIQGAIIATPTPTHAEVALSLLESSHPVLIEKPIANTMEEAKRIAKTAAAKGVPVAVGHTEHFNPAVAKLAEIIHTNSRIGKVLAVHSRRLGKKKAHNPQTNVVCEIGVHDLDVFATLAGGFDGLTAHPVWLHGENGSVMAAGVHLAGASFAGLLELSWLSNYKVRSLSVIATEAMVELNYISQRITLINGDFAKYANGAAPGSFSEFILQFGEPQRTDVPLRREEPLLLELMDFVQTLTEGNPPEVGIEDGIAALSLAISGSSYHNLQH